MVLPIMAFMLAGCSGQISFGQPPAPAAPIVIHPGQAAVAPAAGTVVEDTESPIEIVNTALGQAQTTRNLVRQLSRR